MPRGKKESNRPSAGGITRNDYHRRNRRENKSMHRHSFGANVPLVRVRVVKRLERLLTRLHVQEFNEREHQRAPEVVDEQAFFNYEAALCSLQFPELLYNPPFLTREEIKARRFSDQYGEMNDRWWEWERERRVMSTKGQPSRFVWR